MYLSKGEYTQFSEKGKLSLLNEFGTLLTEKYEDEIVIKIYRLYDFYVEVFYSEKHLVKLEPVLFPQLMHYYL
jgi:hypothetical protein